MRRDNLHTFEQSTCTPNLWKRDGKYYRLFADGTTPNGCWKVNPRMIELKDIDIPTGEDVLGEEIIPLDMGTVSACHVSKYQWLELQTDNQKGISK